MVTESSLVHGLTIFLALQVLTIANALKYSPDDYYIDDDDNGIRKSPFTNGAAIVGEDDSDVSDCEYLRHAIKTLHVDVSSLRRTVRDLYEDELSAIRRAVERLEEKLIPPTNPLGTLIGVNNPALAGSLVGSGNLGIAQGTERLSNYGPGATASSSKDDLAHIVDPHFSVPAVDQFGQAPRPQNQPYTLREIFPGAYGDRPRLFGSDLPFLPILPRQLLPPGFA